MSGLHSAISNLQMARAQIEAVQSKLQPTIRKYLTDELDDALKDIGRAAAQVAEHECPQGLSKIREFIDRHRNCKGEILAATDFMPDVVRLDCEGCNHNIQARV